MGSFIERGAHEPSLDEAAKWDSAEAKAEKVSVSAKVSQSGSGKAPKKTK